ncbi:hypothetical protein EVAR_3883_1 [Eumeta japonica]|uniref:Mos1 transposase HTH domain-containing protein n=1 Tax=Eumeta variegata TaxID=151549 RepID=A0A4C1ST56_EUMVA|nr:hypothetical protein EVAR_3883_1 [Eumeta japonica]
MHQLISTLGDGAPSKGTVYHWFREFNRGQSMLADEFKKGRPESVVVPQNINAVRELIMQDRHVTHREIKAFLSIKEKERKMKGKQRERKDLNREDRERYLGCRQTAAY